MFLRIRRRFIYITSSSSISTIVFFLGNYAEKFQIFQWKLHWRVFDFFPFF